METIRKKVSLEDARIRLSGCTIPIISESEDSLGNIYSDISGSTNGYIRIKTQAREYSKLLNIIRNGIKLNRKTNLSDCAGVGSENRYVIADDFDILPITCGHYVLGYEAYPTSAFTKVNETEYETSLAIRSKTVVLTNDFDEFERLGGTNKIIKAYQYLFCGVKDGGEYVSPYVEIPLLLNQDLSDIGHMTDYQDDFDDFPNEDGISVDTRFRNDIPNPLSATTVALSGYTTDSKLQFLRTGELYTDDDGNLLPGVYSPISANTFFRYTYHPSSGTFTIARYDAASGYPCGDGEALEPGVSKYRTSSIPETAKKFLIENKAPEGTYYFLIKNQNDANRRMGIPFVVSPSGEGNRVSAITIENNFITFVYVYNGVVYNETYKYDTGQTMTINLDGLENIEIYYDKIDYEFTQQTIYNKHYGLSREGNLAEISAYTVADVWGHYDSENTINAPVFKEEYLLGISSAFESEVDVTIDRGNAAAFEKHFKLGECNTYEDLENYGNNYFNL